MKNIWLNDKIGMDPVKFRDGKLLLQANTGGGKSMAIRLISEQVADIIPHIILDTEGEFHTLRQKYDYLLIGKGQEITADHKTAALLAHRLIEGRASAVIDLFEMSPWERETFVKNFVSAMTNAPKNLWLPTLLTIDEAQTYAPEGDKTECGRTLHDAAFKFRKRHFGIIFATPRISAISKNIISTCKNKLIGYTSYEGDVKRAAYELGFTTKDQWRSLRDLEPGEFFAFGPAISKEVIKIKLGQPKTSHGDEGAVQSKVAPPSAKLKKALAALADLPQAAAEEATTLAEFKKENANLKRELTLTKRAPVLDPAKEKEIQQKWYDLGVEAEKTKMRQKMAQTEKILQQVQKLISPLLMIDISKEFAKSMASLPKITVKKEAPAPVPTLDVPMDGLTGPEQRILDAIAWLESIGVPEPEQTAVAFLAGYTYGGGGFNNPKGALRTKGMIQYRGKSLVLTEEGRAVAKAPDAPLTQEALHEKVLSVLPTPEKRLLQPLLVAYPSDMSNEELAEASGYKAGTGGFNNPKGRLRTLGLVEYPSSGRIKARDILFL